MQQLIEQLTTQYKISEDDAIGIVNVIATYAEEKSPGLGNSLVNIINGTDESTGGESIAATSTAVTSEAATPVAEAKEESYFEKAKDFVEGHIPGGLKEKAEKMVGGVESKIKGLFS